MNRAAILLLIQIIALTSAASAGAAQSVGCLRLNHALSLAMLKSQEMGVSQERAKESILGRYQGMAEYPIFLSALAQAYQDPKKFTEFRRDGNLMKWCLEQARPSY